MAMAMESKHIVSLLVVSVILIILYISYGKDKRYKKGKSVKENFVDETMIEDNGENEEGFEDIIEHFPQMTPMNVIYNDTNGNLSNTSDLGLQNLTITGNGALQLGSKFRLNANKDFWADDEWLRLTNSANTDYYGGFAAGKLWAQGNLSTDTLNVRSDGTVEKGLTVKGDITAKSNISVPSGKMITVRDDNHAIGQSGVWGSTRDGTTVLGWDGGILASCHNGAGKYEYKEALVWDNGRNVSVGNNLSVGGKLQEGGNNLVPRGIILMWSGESPPAGWAICNGDNSTPDLRNKFIVGTGSNYSLGKTGGEDSVTLTAEQMPSHTHKLNDNGEYKTVSGYQVYCGGSSNFNQVLYGGSTGLDGLYSAGAGSSQPHENRPPFYALAYIMKL